MTADFMGNADQWEMRQERIAIMEVEKVPQNEIVVILNMYPEQYGIIYEGHGTQTDLFNTRVALIMP